MALRNGDVPGVGLGDPSIGVEGRRFAWRLRMTVGERSCSVAPGCHDRAWEPLRSVITFTPLRHPERTK